LFFLIGLNSSIVDMCLIKRFLQDYNVKGVDGAGDGVSLCKHVRGVVSRVS